MYDIPRAVARMVVRTAAGRDRVRISRAPARGDQYTAPDDLRVMANGYIGRQGGAVDGTAAVDQHEGTLIVSARASGRRCPSQAPNESAAHPTSTGVSTARFSEQLTVSDA